MLTPHAGELGRLLEVDSSEVERARLPTRAPRPPRSKALVVLKGDDTLVAAPSGRVAISRGGAPALATAGTGDVLAGVTGAMLAKGLPHAHAACAAVYRARARGAARRRAARPRRGDRLRRDRRAARGALRVGLRRRMPLTVADIMDIDTPAVTPEDADLHLPHYFELFGGFVFLEPLSHFEERLRKATDALTRE